MCFPLFVHSPMFPTNQLLDTRYKKYRPLDRAANSGEKKVRSGLSDVFGPPGLMRCHAWRSPIGRNHRFLEGAPRTRHRKEPVAGGCPQDALNATEAVGFDISYLACSGCKVSFCNPPIRELADGNFVLVPAINFVHGTELLHLFARGSKLAENLSVQFHFVNFHRSPCRAVVLRIDPYAMPPIAKP